MVVAVKRRAALAVLRLSAVFYSVVMTRHPFMTRTRTMLNANPPVARASVQGVRQ
jgi:hypothetical protein